MKEYHSCPVCVFMSIRNIFLLGIICGHDFFYGFTKCFCICLFISHNANRMWKGPIHLRPHKKEESTRQYPLPIRKRKKSPEMRISGRTLGYQTLRHLPECSDESDVLLTSNCHGSLLRSHHNQIVIFLMTAFKLDHLKFS